MAKVELDPNWWKKNAPKSIAGGAVQGALAEVAKHGGGNLEKTGHPGNYFKALDNLKAAIFKDEQTANKAKDNVALAMLANLKQAHVEGRGKAEAHLKLKGDGQVKGL
jgi:hypothetical protein